jgi:hypothetical protein
MQVGPTCDREGRQEAGEMKRLCFAMAALIVAGAFTAQVLGGGAATPSAQAALPQNGLLADVVPTQRAPLPACSPDESDCTALNRVDYFIYITNLNQLAPLPINLSGPPLNRATLPNAYVVSSFDQTIYVNGSVYGQSTITPPPNLTAFLGTAGKWPSTVTCGQPPTVPCNVVTSPAILSGEQTSIFFPGWIHVSNEPNGAYVFSYTVHGTLNGTPVNLTASSPPIQMTG